MTTTVIAILALFLSSLSLYLQWRVSRPKLVVAIECKTRSRRLSYDPLTDQSESEDQEALVATLRNHGDRSITPQEGFLRPLFGQRVSVGVLSDPRGGGDVQKDATREVVVFPREFVMRTSALARRIGLYRLEIHDQMGRRWSSRYVRLAARQNPS